MIAYDHKRCIKMAEIAALAYLDVEDGDAKIREFGYQPEGFFDSGGSQAYLMSTEFGHVLSFRGTELDDVRDILADVEFNLIELDQQGVMVHEGFLDALADIRFQIASSIMSLGITSLSITGHSLGAALATIEATYLTLECIDVSSVWTFGSPDVGTKSFSRYFGSLGLNGKTFRLVNNNDVVPVALELEIMKPFGFEHVGRFFYIKEDGGVPIEDPSMWTVMLDKGYGILKDIGELGLDGFKDHSMEDGYLKSLRKAK